MLFQIQLQRKTSEWNCEELKIYSLQELSVNSLLWLKDQLLEKGYLESTLESSGFTCSLQLSWLEQNTTGSLFKIYKPTPKWFYKKKTRQCISYNVSRLCSLPISFKLLFRCGWFRSYLVTCILLQSTVKPFPTIPRCPLSATLTSAVLTQKMDPQYSSRAAAHMVHADGFTFPYTAPLALCFTAAEADWNASTFSPDHHTRETIAGCDSEGLWATRLWSRNPSLRPPCAEKKTKICQRNTESVSEVTDFKCFRQKIIQVFHKQFSVLVEPSRRSHTQCCGCLNEKTQQEQRKSLIKSSPEPAHWHSHV